MKSSTEKIYFPLFLDISGKNFLVVGSGKVAERKIRTLLRFKANIKVVSSRISKNVKKMAEKGLIVAKEKNYETSDLDGIDFVISATNDSKINRKISLDAKNLKIPVNVVDDPELCDFIMPSIVKRGQMVLAISTSGRLPFLSKKLRMDLEKMVDSDYLKYFLKMAKVREKIKGEIRDKKEKERMLKILSNMDVKEVAKMRLRDLEKVLSKIKG